jgi:hypothetical protein
MGCLFCPAVFADGPLDRRSANARFIAIGAIAQPGDAVFTPHLGVLSFFDAIAPPRAAMIELHQSSITFDQEDSGGLEGDTDPSLTRFERCCGLSAVGTQGLRKPIFFLHHGPQADKLHHWLPASRPALGCAASTDPAARLDDAAGRD